MAHETDVGFSALDFLMLISNVFVFGNMTDTPTLYVSN